MIYLVIIRTYKGHGMGHRQQKGGQLSHGNRKGKATGMAKEASLRGVLGCSSAAAAVLALEHTRPRPRCVRAGGAMTTFYCFSDAALIATCVPVCL